MPGRRKFLQQMGLGAGAALISNHLKAGWYSNLQSTLQKYAHFGAAELAKEEDFWYYIQQAYTQGSGLINLNNGGVAPAPKVVQEAMKQHYDMSNLAPSYYMWRVLDQGREPVRKKLAALAGCSPEEIAIQRNASEALETIIFGIDLQRGDEVVLSLQDYPNMIAAWKQRERREGIKLVWADLRFPSEDNEYLVDSYTRLFTDKTKMVQLTHVINWVGQVLPVAAIAAAARQRGIAVMVDGAHSFAQFNFTIPSLNCDYFGTSLHKWLGAPIGTGLLYVRRDKIKSLYPLMGATEEHLDNIRKYEHLGTRPFFIEMAIDQAIDFHEMIGTERKFARLLYLKNYWMQRVKNLKGVQLKSSVHPAFGCAIGMLSVSGKSEEALSNHLMDNYKVHTTSINRAGINGLRITPNVYTSLKNLDTLVEAITTFTAH